MDKNEDLVKKLGIKIRRNEKKDDSQIESLIRTCLKEYGGMRENTAWTDPYLGRFSEVYNKENNAYWVAVDENDRVVCGVGIGPLEGVSGVCELQKMYTYKEFRGIGLAQKLLDIALEFAKKYYNKCYLETFENMVEAQSFYKRNGFEYVVEYIGNTGHHGCEVKMIKNLENKN